MLLQKVIKKQIFAAKKEAVIDLGSNSIRMIIFEDFNKSQIPIFNEKAVCSLGNTLYLTGKLDPLGVQIVICCPRNQHIKIRSINERTFL